MSDFSQADLGFIRAMARELIVNNNKEYHDLTHALEEAEAFLKLFNIRYATSHAQANDHDKSRR